MQGLPIRAGARRAPAYTDTVFAGFAWEGWDWLPHDAPEVYDVRSTALLLAFFWRVVDRIIAWSSFFFLPFAIEKETRNCIVKVTQSQRALKIEVTSHIRLHSVAAV